MAATLVRILDGNTFVVSDERGDIEASKTDPTGLFSYDMRFLSTWVLTINDMRLNALSTDDLQYFEARFFLVPATGTVYIDPKLSVIRQRAVGLGFHEELTILSHSAEPADLTIRIEAASDFADLFEVKDALPKLGTYDTKVDGRVAGARLPARDVPARDDDLGLRARHRRRARPDVHGHGRAARHLDHGPQRRDVAGRPRPAGHRDEVRPGEPQGATRHGPEPRDVDRRGAAPRVRLGAAQVDLPPQPRGPGRPALLAADRRAAAASRRRACRGS